VHTSAKARLISVAIRIRIRDPDRHQNLIVCSLAHCQPSLKISCKTVQQSLHKVANRQTNKQRQLHILFGGCNKNVYSFSAKQSVDEVDRMDRTICSHYILYKFLFPALCDFAHQHVSLPPPKEYCCLLFDWLSELVVYTYRFGGRSDTHDLTGFKRR